MGSKTTAHHTTLVANRLAGNHDTHVEALLGAIKVMIPGLVITVTDPQAIWCIWKAWMEAMRIAPKVFNGLTAPAYQVSPVTRLYASVAITGWQPGRQVQGKAHNHSPSGCGELRVRVGGLTIIMDDQAAYDRQLVTWASAYDLGQRDVWPGVLGER